MDDTDLLRQAKMTAMDYLEAASDYLHESKYFARTFDNCMRLAEFMAKDFETMKLNQSLEEVSCGIHNIHHEVKQIKEFM